MAGPPDEPAAAAAGPAPLTEPTYRRHGGRRVRPVEPARVDLHAHTRRSDGLLEPAELMRQAAGAGVRLLAITDHDTLAACLELRGVALPPGLAVLAGVEINCVADDAFAGLWEGELHILGLGVDLDDRELDSRLVAQRRRRRERFEAVLANLRRLGRPIDELVAAIPADERAAIGRPHLARMLVEAGHAADVDDAMRRWLAHGAPAWAPRVGMGPREAIEVIRGAGGLAVLAHFSEAPDRPDVLDALVAWGLGGLEVHYRAFGADTVAALEAIARDRSLVPTGGTDYHGDGAPYAAVHARFAIPSSVADRVLAAVTPHRSLLSR